MKVPSRTDCETVKEAMSKMRGVQLMVVITGLVVVLPLLGQSGGPREDPEPQAKAPDTAAGRPRDPGLYMTFDTDKGAITCKLYESEAPETVRKIVGLALGKVSYVDPTTQKPVRGKRFYDGLIFHRVMPNFMIQGGDPLGTGMGGPGGPGFPFKDEFVATSRFDVPGRLAMANSGPNTNGSQFFITEVPTPHLNNRHTIFGQCENVDVVRAIARVPRDGSDKPQTPVRIKRVAIERVGMAPTNPPEGGPAVPAAKTAPQAPAKPAAPPPAKKPPM